jgi:hypothetical protein
MRGVWLFVITFFFFNCNAQFSPPAGYPGSTAIFRDSSVFVGWATSCNLQLGWQNMADTTFGKADAGTAASATGRAGENGTVSLGDGGTATLTFASSIFNGSGADFAVFENAFIDSFLEFAFVEVSSDGSRFVRFPAISNIQDTLQTPAFGLSDCSLLYNMAGTFRVNFGTPFDLEELKDSTGIDVNDIRYVRIVDAVGSIDPQYATYDINGKMINDPWPTEFPSSGFDLDAVGVIHQNPLAVNNFSNLKYSLYPNPVSSKLFIEGDFDACKLVDAQGRQLLTITQKEIEFEQYENGLYALIFRKGEQYFKATVIKTD